MYPPEWKNAWNEHFKVQAAETAGVVGKKTDALLRRGRQLAERGYQRQALAVLTEAVSLHSPDATDAVAASAFHALAVALDDKVEVRRTANHEADQWFRRALASTQRMKSPLRRGVTLYSHAACLRRLAHDPGPVDKRALVAEAERSLRESADALESLGPLALSDLACALSNLGNLLLDERQSADAAVSVYERAYRAADLANAFGALHPDLADLLRGRASDVRRGILPAIVHALGQSRRPGARAKAEKLARQHINDPDLELADKMVCALVRSLQASPSKAAHVEAQKILRLRRPDQTLLGRPDLALQRADLLERAGLREDARDLLHASIRAQWQRREMAMSDDDSDAVTADAQRLATRLARIQLAEQKPIEAFLTLENSAGLRFNDLHASEGYRPSTSRARYLHERWRSQTEVASVLLQVRDIARLGADDMLEGFLGGLAAHPQEEMADGLTEAGAANISDLLARIPRTTVAAAQFVDAELAKLAQGMPRAHSALLDDDPGARALWGVQNSMSEDVLHDLLAAHPGVVVLRLLGDDSNLVALTVWHDSSKTAARHRRIGVPDNIRKALFTAINAEILDLDGLDAVVRRIDLAGILPDRPASRLVVLTSGWASWLPIAALAVGRQVLADVVNSIVHMPNLAPLRQPRHRDPLRLAEVGVVGPDVAVGDIAFGVCDLDLLCGEVATWRAVRAHVRAARTVSIVAHGQHEAFESPFLRLAAGEHLVPDGAAWRGVERVELWACTSGISLPHGMFSTPVDEGQGLDYAFLGAGVHAAIGTHWPVSELLTAMIARRYRVQLAAGQDAPAALLAAQRWWRMSAAPALISAVERDGGQGLAAAIEQLLGVAVHPDLVRRYLGPEGHDDVVKDVTRKLKSCWAWAGFRYVGWEGGPIVPAMPLPDQEERRAIDEALAQPRQNGVRLADAVDAELERGIEGPLDADKAADIGALCSLRWRGAGESNRLIGLAVLHELLASPNLAQADRADLTALTAWLWLDVAEDESPLPLSPALPIPRLRCNSLLAAIPEPHAALALAIRARWKWLGSDPMQLVPALGELADHIVELLDSGSTRRREVLLGNLVCVWLLSRVAVWPRLAEVRRERLRVLATSWRNRLSPRNLAEFVLGEAVSATVAALNGDLPPEAVPDLPAWLLARWHQATTNRAPEVGSSNHAVSKSTSNVLGDMEGAVTGYPSDPPQHWWHDPGVLGEAYRHTSGAYLESHSKQFGDAAHILACLQFQADQFPGWCGALARMFAVRLHMPARLRELLGILRRVRHGDELLRSAAVASSPESDGFRLNRTVLAVEAARVYNLTAWILADTCAPDGDPPTRAAAFAALRHRQALANNLAERFGPFLALAKDSPDVADQIREWLRPLVKLEEHEAGFRGMQPGYGTIGVFSAPMGRLGMVAAWNAGQGLRQTTVAIAAPGALATLLAPIRTSAERAAVFTKLLETLREPLGRLLGEALQGSALVWSVLAPGPYRSLPWLGLYAGSVRISDRVQALTHIASITKLAPIPPSKRLRLASWLAASPAVGGLPFTAQVERALRRWRPVDVQLENAPPDGMRIGEVDRLEIEAPRLDVCRICAVANPVAESAAVAGLAIDRGRTFTAWNLIQTLWARGGRVELWTDHHTMDDVVLANGRGADRLPGLVGPLLAGGAMSVLDLAWPVHDLVKALVLEQYGWRGGGAVALREAVVGVRSMLASWRPEAAAAPNVARALELLEHRRKQHAAALGVPTAAVAHFDSPDIFLGDFVADVCAPVHVAAFRWWGWP